MNQKIIKVIRVITAGILLIVSILYLAKSIIDLSSGPSDNNQLLETAYRVDSLISLIAASAYGVIALFIVLSTMHEKEVSENVYLSAEFVFFGCTTCDMLNTIAFHYNEVKIFHWVIMFVSIIPIIVVALSIQGFLEPKIAQIILMGSVVYGFIENIIVLTICESVLGFVICFFEIGIFASYIGYYACKLTMKDEKDKEIKKTHE